MFKNSKKCLALGLALMLLAGMMISVAPVLAEDGTDLIVNGNFEFETDEIEAPWYHDPGVTLSSDAPLSPAGGKYIKVAAANNKGLQQAVTIEPGASYEISLYAKYDKFTEKEFHLVGLDVLPTFTSPVVETDKTTYTGWKYNWFVYNGGSEWRLHKTVMTMPAEYSKVTLQFRAGNDVKNLCIDGVKMVKLTDAKDENLVFRADLETAVDTVPAEGISTDETVTQYGVNYLSSSDVPEGIGSTKAIELQGSESSTDYSVIYTTGYVPTATERFVLTGWVKVPSGNASGSYGALQVGQNSAEEGALGKKTFYSTPNNDWQKFTYRLNRGQVSLLGLKLTMHGEGSVLFDDIRIERIVDGSGAAVGNLIVNGDFEGIGTVNSEGIVTFGEQDSVISKVGGTWGTAENDADDTFVWSTNSPHSGSHCIRVNNGASNIYLKIVPADMQIGTLYKFSWWQKNVSGSTWAKADVENSKDWACIAFEESQGAEWKKHEMYFRLLEGEKGHNDYIRLMRASSTEIYIDDLELVAVDEIYGDTRFLQEGAEIQGINEGAVTVMKPIFGKNNADSNKYLNIVAVKKFDGGTRELVEVKTIEKTVKYTNTTSLQLVEPDTKSVEVTVPDIVGDETYRIESFLWDGTTLKPYVDKDVLK